MADISKVKAIQAEIYSVLVLILFKQQEQLVTAYFRFQMRIKMKSKHCLEGNTLYTDSQVSTASGENLHFAELS